MNLSKNGNLVQKNVRLSVKPAFLQNAFTRKSCGICKNYTNLITLIIFGTQVRISEKSFKGRFWVCWNS